MKSKLISLLVMLVVSVLALAACGGAQPAPQSEAPADTSEQEAAPAAETETEAEAEADTEAPAEAEAAIQVTNPDGYDIDKCFVAAPANDGTVQYEAKPGPYKIAVSNSFIGNDWRTQMIQMGKAYVEQPHVAPLIEEFTLVSSGQDVAAQIAQMDNMIASGVDAIILNAASPTAFDAVIRRANDAGIIVVSFDNIVTAPEAVLVNEDQVAFGRTMAEDLVERLDGSGNVVMVNGVAGTSVDTDRQTGAKEVFDATDGIDVVAEVVGNWDTGTAQKVMADLLATRDDIDAVWAQGGSPGVVQAYLDADRPFVPMAGEAENGFRKQLAEYQDEGLVGISVGQSPGLIAVSIQAALELLQGKELPRVIAAPLPIATTETLEAGVNYFPDLPDSFFTPIQFPDCGVNLTADEILAQGEDSQVSTQPEAEAETEEVAEADMSDDMAAMPEGYSLESCFVAGPANDGMVQYEAKPGPYKIAVSNSFIGNDWRTQMIQMGKAYVEQPHVAPLIEEFTLVSSGQDVAAQIAQMDNMIASGVDAIILNAASPTAFDAVIRRANDAGIIVVSFDNIVTAPEAVLVNEDQVAFGRTMAEDLVERLDGSGNVVMVNGVAGTSVDTDRQTGAKEVFDATDGIDVVAEVVGNWDTGTAQKVMADLLATRDDIDAVWAQGGSPGVVQAYLDADRPFVPMAGEAENGFRKQLAEYQDEGLVGISVGQSPGLIAVSIQAALELLQGKELPRVIAAPLPIATTETLEAGVNYFPDLPDSFFTPIQFPDCGVNLTADEILVQSGE